ncbi:hypothetical protein AB9E28_35110, partial [Rhizobium leguminosarum]
MRELLDTLVDAGRDFVVDEDTGKASDLEQVAAVRKFLRQVLDLAADPFTTAENQATEQAAKIQNMILQGYDAIVLNAASPTAL